jgi:hypothetical protein
MALAMANPAAKQITEMISVVMLVKLAGRILRDDAITKPRMTRDIIV